MLRFTKLVLQPQCIGLPFCHVDQVAQFLDAIMFEPPTRKRADKFFVTLHEALLDKPFVSAPACGIMRATFSIRLVDMFA